ncbi:MAG: hypothetical protein D3926_03160 [Desulfobacteraceae bacterium]|nr:MAG: hypothetical protein D3926_03160 [Desulfobacteraceae bacterium]
MMEKDKLRKADIFSGGLILLVGLFIVSQALQMPMKDSWGGVQNVWYVSPAIFPLFVGGMITLLGALLVRTALKEVGFKAMGDVLGFMVSSELARFLKLEANIRFYAIIVCLLSFVYLYIPRVDFFLTAILFLMVFIMMFHLNDTAVLKKLLWFFLGQAGLMILLLITGIMTSLSSFAPYPGDVLTLIYIISLIGFAFFVCKGNQEHRRKLKTILAVAILSPIIIGVIFKYLLLVPMPFEGMVVELLDLIWYG